MIISLQVNSVVFFIVIGQLINGVKFRLSFGSSKFYAGAITWPVYNVSTISNLDIAYDIMVSLHL